MNQLNLSTSSFDRSYATPEAKARSASPVRDGIRVAIWFVIGLVAIDVLINNIFAYPSDPQIKSASRLSAYFEYGRSSVGQLARLTRADPSKTAPITLTGWYDPLLIQESPSDVRKPIITFYGMSHTVRLGAALGRTSDRFSPRIVGAPGASTNWSYGAYLRDRGGSKSRAVVLGLMSANLPMITTMSPMTWNFEFPMPYTADRFYIEEDHLRVVHPPYTSFEQYIETFYDKAKWEAALDVFAMNDSMYNSLIINANIFDHSSLLRLVRRAYGQFFLRNMRKNVLDQTGFRPESEQIQVARLMVRDFARLARRDGVIPVIFIVNNLGYSDFLYQALKPILDTDRIPYLSSHTIVSPNDPRGYLPDNHFIDAVDNKLACALVDLIESQ